MNGRTLCVSHYQASDMTTLGIPTSWEGLGVSGLILLVMLSIIRGWIVPGNIVDRLLKAKDETIRSLNDTNADLRAIAEPLVKVLEALNATAEDTARRQHND